MIPTDVKLYTVVVLDMPPPRWQRASKPIPRSTAATIVAKHWARGRIVRLHPPRPLDGTSGQVLRFPRMFDSTRGRRNSTSSP